jgi:hypothetical protein
VLESVLAELDGCVNPGIDDDETGGSCPRKLSTSPISEIKKVTEHSFLFYLVLIYLLTP